MVSTTEPTSSLCLKAFSNQLHPFFFFWCSALSSLHAHLISTPRSFHNFCSSHLKRNDEFSNYLYFIQQTYSALGNEKHGRCNTENTSRQIQENTLYSPQLLFHRFCTHCTSSLLPLHLPKICIVMFAIQIILLCCFHPQVRFLFNPKEHHSCK